MVRRGFRKMLEGWSEYRVVADFGAAAEVILLTANLDLGQEWLLICDVPTPAECGVDLLRSLGGRGSKGL